MDILVEEGGSCRTKRSRSVDEVEQLHITKRIYRSGSCSNSSSSLSNGDKVKNLGVVVQTRKSSRKRQPNFVCRVEAFGRVVSEFDDLRVRWVGEMGFGGLLHMVGMSLPRTMCYWLMTRVDATKETITLGDGHECILTANQVRWVLGIPNGGKVIPRKIVDEEMKLRVDGIKRNYGLERTGLVKKIGKVICGNGVTVTDAMIDKLKGEWSEGEEAEFKVLFLLFTLYMVLCPTQRRFLEPDLLPALTCASLAFEFD